MSTAILFDSTVVPTLESFGTGLLGRVADHTVTDDAYQCGYTAAYHSNFAEVLPPDSFNETQRQAFFSGRTEGYRQLEHDLDDAMLATMSADALRRMEHDFYERLELRGAWGGHDDREAAEMWFTAKERIQLAHVVAAYPL